MSECNCPFYGYGHISRVNYLTPSHGNQCGLVTGDHITPCQMETRGEPVSWQNCGFNRDAQSSPLKARELESFLDGCKIFPEGRGEMSLRQWFEEKTQ